jgi:PAS domain S-box-containing protein
MQSWTAFLPVLAHSIALAVILAFGASTIAHYCRPQASRRLQVVNGVFFGALSVLFMGVPLTLQPGVFVDLRNLVVFFAGPFGGPIAVIIAGTLAGAYRLSLGGAGALGGCGAIVTCALLGWLVGRYHGPLTRLWQAALAGVIVTAAILPWTLTLGSSAMSWTQLRALILPYGLVHIIGAVVLTGLLILGTRRQAAESRTSFNEQRFRDIAEMASDWFWEMDADLRLTYVSPRLLEITGYDGEYFCGKRRSDVVEGLSRAELAAHEEVLRRHEPFRDFTYSLTTARGERLQATASGKPIFDTEGNFAGYRGSGRDITEAARRKEELDAARVTAETANKAKSDFLATVSHELRTPLNAIIGFAEIMKKEMFGPHSTAKYRDYAEDIHGSANHLLQLVNDVLDTAKVESGKIVLDKADCDLANIVGSALTLVKARAQQAEVTITTDIASPIPLAAVDERAIKQIILNLLVNAVKFTEPGGSVRLTLGFDPHRGHIITVDDSGIGIPPEDLKRVLEPFGQSSNGKDVSLEGTGLGLPLAKALVEAHGGSLELESTLGIGTTVRVVLRTEAALAQTAKEQHGLTDQAAAPRQRSGHQPLV